MEVALPLFVLLLLVEGDGEGEAETVLLTDTELEALTLTLDEALAVLLGVGRTGVIDTLPVAEGEGVGSDDGDVEGVAELLCVEVSETVGVEE